MAQAGAKTSSQASLVNRPQRWDEPFGDNMTEEVVDQLLSIKPFALIDGAAFPPSVPLRGILLNDCRINRYQDGEIIIREGDYGTSAFMLLHGQARVTLKPVPAELLGRATVRRKSFFESLSQLWSNSRHAETRRNVDSRSSDDRSNAPRAFIQDLPRVMSMDDTVLLEPGEFFWRIGGPDQNAANGHRAGRR